MKSNLNDAIRRELLGMQDSLTMLDITGEHERYLQVIDIRAGQGMMDTG